MSQEKNYMEHQIGELNQTIEDLADKLRDSMIMAHGRDEGNSGPTRVWVKDEEVKECFACKKDFNARRRKHHCRQ